MFLHGMRRTASAGEVARDSWENGLKIQTTSKLQVILPVMIPTQLFKTVNFRIAESRTRITFSFSSWKSSHHSE